MRPSMTIHGGQELAARLGELPASLSRRVILEVLRAAAEPMRARMSELAPRATGAPDLADNMSISVANTIGSVRGGKWTSRDQEEHAVAVGPAKAFFYGLMQEYGTIHHGAQAFARPAFDEKAPESLGIIGQRLWDELRKRSIGSGSTRSSGGGGGLL